MARFATLVQKKGDPKNGLESKSKMDHASRSQIPEATLSIQPQLEIGQPNDKPASPAGRYEEEAKATADAVQAMPMERAEGIQMMPDEEEGLRMMPMEEETMQMMPDEEESIKMMPDDDDGQPRLDIQKNADGSSQVSPAFASQLGSTKSGGQSLPKGVQREIGTKTGTDFSDVKVHNNGQAAEMSSAIGARAFTHGSDIYFNKGEYNPNSQSGKHLLTHELTHTVQQGAVASPKIQRYGTGEHTQFGEVNSMIEPDHQAYTVLAGEGLIVIARKFGVDVADLRELNLNKLHDFDIDGRSVTGFLVGEEILIPSTNVRLNDAPATASGQRPITIQGIVFTYGEVIAIADFFASPADLYTASPSDLRTMKGLLVREARSPGSVTTDEWQNATGGRYLDLAQNNDAHFAPQNAMLVPSSAAGSTSDNHKDMWEMHHRAALDLVVAGDLDRAMATNAFADHFLTDAFAAGHLINKQDIMAFAQGTITGNEDAVFDGIAEVAWRDPALVALCSRHESTSWHHRNIETESVFSTLLETIYEDAASGRPLILNAYAKIVHDDLNTNMVEVANLAGDRWPLSGDDSLNADSLAIGRKAVAQSQINILNAQNAISSLDYPPLFANVWQYVPFPTTAGEATIQDRVNATGSALEQTSIDAMAALIISEIETIIQGLVDEGHLQLN